MNSRLKQNSEIKDAIEISNNMNKKGRSKSRRANPHKTIDDVDF